MVTALLGLTLAGCGGSSGNEELTTGGVVGQQAEVPADETGRPPGPTAGSMQFPGAVVDPTEGGPPQLRPPAAAGPQPIKVGLLLPLTGPAAEAGKAMLSAAQLALFDAGDARLTLLPRDTAGTPAGAIQAMNDVLSEGAEVVLGPVFADAVAAVAPRARDRGINVIAFSNDRTVAGEGVYLMGLLPEAQVSRVVGYADRQGLRRFAVLAPDSPYGNRVIEAMQEAALRTGAEITQVVIYPAEAGPGDEALLASVRRLADYEARRAALEDQRKALEERDDELSRRALRRLESLDAYGELDYDAVLLADGGTRLTAVAPLLPFYDIDTSKIRLLGTALWDDPGIAAEPALQGAWFAAPPPTGRTAFQDRFRKVYGNKPPRIASLAYDAVALTAILSAERPADLSFAATETPIDIFAEEALTNLSGFVGYDGIFRFEVEGVAERGLSVLEVRQRDFREIDPAPTSFEDVFN